MLEADGLERAKALLEVELERLKNAHAAGVTIAVPAALDFCLEHRLAPPSWLFKQHWNCFAIFSSGRNLRNVGVPVVQLRAIGRT
jgi:hypothetical protein